MPALCLRTSEDDIEDRQPGKQAELKEEQGRQTNKQSDRLRGIQELERFRGQLAQSSRLGLDYRGCLYALKTMQRLLFIFFLNVPSLHTPRDEAYCCQDCVKV